ncbi:hypothetical protein NQZ68_019296 [Dissostichus eleginoides]|nr:hypothetical protein NQZ68_019296 [Dissostichus eleginoides]
MKSHDRENNDLQEKRKAEEGTAADRGRAPVRQSSLAESFQRGKSLLESSLKSLLKSSLESLLKSPLESLLESPLKSPLESLLKSPLESSLGSPLESPLESPLKSPLESPLKFLLRSPLESLLEFPLESPLEFPLKSPFKSPLESPLKLCEQKETVTTVLCLLGKSSLCLSDEDWAKISLSIDALRPFEEGLLRHHMHQLQKVGYGQSLTLKCLHPSSIARLATMSLSKCATSQKRR